MKTQQLQGVQAAVKPPNSKKKEDNVFIAAFVV